LLWLIPAGIFAAAYRYNWDIVWTAVGARTRTPPFLDLRSIPTAVRVMQRGGDPLTNNPLDTLHRPFNYPRIWLYAFEFLHITEQNFWIVGILFCALFLLCISKLIRERERAWEHLVLLVAGLSVSVMFGFERGNTDLLIFALVFFGCSLNKAPQRTVTFLAGALLKFFPLAALAAETVRQRGRNRLWPMGGLLAGVAFLALQRRDLALIQTGTPTSVAASYGALSLRETVWYLLVRHGWLRSNEMLVGIICALACWIGGLLLVVYVLRRPNRFDGEKLQSRAGDWFFVFGAIYAATFAIGSNWDYRLIFLIPTLPFAFDLASRNSRWALVYIPCVLLAENCVAYEWENTSLPGQYLTVALFFMILAVLAEQAKCYLGVTNRAARTAPIAAETMAVEVESPVYR
jgi:hypothetical protein